TGQFLGYLTGADGNPLAFEGLWYLTFGNGGNGGDPNTLYFTAGLNRTGPGSFGAADGLFGSIRPVLTPVGSTPPAPGPAAIARSTAHPRGDGGALATLDLMPAAAALSKGSSGQPALPAALGDAAFEGQAPPLKAVNVDQVFSSAGGEDQVLALFPPAQ